MEPIYILAILGIIIVICISAIAISVKKRITSFRTRGSAEHGGTKLTGEAEFKAASPTSNNEMGFQVSDDSVDISENTNIFGKNIVDIVKSGFIRVAKNINIGGESKISVSNNSSELSNKNQRQKREKEPIQMQSLLAPSTQEKVADHLANLQEIPESE